MFIASRGEIYADQIITRYNLDPVNDNNHTMSRSLNAAVIENGNSPEIKFEMWHGESVFSIKLNSDNSRMVHTTLDNYRYDCKFDNGSTHSVFQLSDGNLEWLIKLDSQPASNIMNFDISVNNLMLYYQDTALFTDDIIYNGPDWAQGSYSVYHRNRRNNIIHISPKDTLRELYETGKAFHIRRPQAFDSGNTTAWCDLHIDTLARQLSIAIPQDFLDHAVYPLTIDPTFGKTSVGAWDLTIANYRHNVLWNIGNAVTGSGQLTNGYVCCDVNGILDGTIQVMVHAYSKGDGLDDSRFVASSSPVDLIDTAAYWVECPMTGYLQDGVEYVASIQGYNSINGKLRIKGDVTAWGDIKYLDLASWDVPDSLTGYSNKNDGYSVYVEYTATGTVNISPSRRRKLIEISEHCPPLSNGYTCRSKTGEMHR